MKTTTFYSALIALSLTIGSISAQAQSEQSQGQISILTTQINQLTLDIENKKLTMLQAKASNSAQSAKLFEADIKRTTDALNVKRAELSLWQQQASFEKQAPSPNPEVQGLKVRIQQITFEKGRLAIMQNQANQAGNKPQAASLGQQIAMKQNEITAKQQEIRIVELKAKAASPPK